MKNQPSLKFFTVSLSTGRNKLVPFGGFYGLARILTF